jgi:hypothetical protein
VLAATDDPPKLEEPPATDDPPKLGEPPTTTAGVPPTAVGVTATREHCRPGKNAPKIIAPIAPEYLFIGLRERERA